MQYQAQSAPCRGVCGFKTCRDHSVTTVARPCMQFRLPPLCARGVVGRPSGPEAVVCVSMLRPGRQQAVGPSQLYQDPVGPHFQCPDSEYGWKALFHHLLCSVLL